MSLEAILLPYSFTRTVVFVFSQVSGLSSLRFLATHAMLGLGSISCSGLDVESDISWLIYKLFATNRLAYLAGRQAGHQKFTIIYLTKILI